MSKKQSIFLTLAILFWVFSFNAHEWVGVSVFYYGYAFIVFASAVIINWNTKDGFQKLISKIFVFYSFNNLIDELFLDPTKVDTFEYVTTIIYTLYLCKTHYLKLHKV